MKRSAPKYPTLPLRIQRQPNGRFKDTYSGRWVSDAELERYSDQPKQNKQNIKHSPSHEEILNKRWDLNRD